MPAIGLALSVTKAFPPTSGGGGPTNTYVQPDGTSNYLQPDGTSYYLQP